MTLPTAIDAERGYLEAAICDPLVVVRHRLSEDAFHRPVYRHVYRALLALVDAQRPVDAISISDEVARSVDGSESTLSTIAEIITGAVTSSAAEHYAEILERTARSRRIYSACHATIKAIGEDSGEGGQRTEDGLRAALEPSASMLLSRSDVGARFRESYDATETGFLPTPIRMLDERTGGLPLSSLVVIGGRPAAGKTAFALNLALTAAESEIPALYLSLEQTAQELHRRLVALLSWRKGRAYGEPLTIDALRFRTAPRDAVHLWSEWVERLPLHIEDRLVNLDRIESRIRRMIYSHKVRLVVVDYAGKIVDPSTSRDQSRERVSIGNASKRLFRVAKDTGACVCLISQLNRDAEGSMSPTLAHLRMSGDLEQDADMVLLLARESREAQWGNCCVRKQRDGSGEGIVRYAYLGPYCAITDHDGGRYE